MSSFATPAGMSGPMPSPPKTPIKKRRHPAEPGATPTSSNEVSKKTISRKKIPFTTKKNRLSYAERYNMASMEEFPASQLKLPAFSGYKDMEDMEHSEERARRRTYERQARKGLAGDEPFTPKVFNHVQGCPYSDASDSSDGEDAENCGDFIYFGRSMKKREEKKEEGSSKNSSCSSTPLKLVFENGQTRDSPFSPISSAEEPLFLKMMTTTQGSRHRSRHLPSK